MAYWAEAAEGILAQQPWKKTTGSPAIVWFIHWPYGESWYSASGNMLGIVLHSPSAETTTTTRTIPAHEKQSII